MISSIKPIRNDSSKGLLNIEFANDIILGPGMYAINRVTVGSHSLHPDYDTCVGVDMRSRCVVLKYEPKDLSLDLIEERIPFESVSSIRYKKDSSSVSRSPRTRKQANK